MTSDLRDFSGAYIIATGKITITAPDNDAYNKNSFLKIMHNLLVASQKLIMRLFIMQRICML